MHSNLPNNCLATSSVCCKKKSLFKIIMNNKYQFLDSLQPDDFRNPSSFNMAEKIVDNILIGYAKAQDKEDFIVSAANNLFRDGCEARANLINLIKKMIDEVKEV